MTAGQCGELQVPLRFHPCACSRSSELVRARPGGRRCGPGAREALSEPLTGKFLGMLRGGLYDLLTFTAAFYAHVCVRTVDIQTQENP